jgi:hypothetical protein
MRNVPQRLASVGLVLGVVLLLLGCGGVGRVREAAARAKKTNQLKLVGLAYHNYQDNNIKPPAGVGDLMPLLASEPDAAQALQSGEFVVLWGAKVPQDFPQGTSLTVLGYDKDVPTKGGLVLMGDGSVQNMTLAEFNAAPRPKGK